MTCLASWSRILLCVGIVLFFDGLVASSSKEKIQNKLSYKKLPTTAPSEPFHGGHHSDTEKQSSALDCSKMEIESSFASFPTVSKTDLVESSTLSLYYFRGSLFPSIFRAINVVTPT